MIAGDAAAPGEDVLRAFGVQGAVIERLVGGRGLTWRAGAVVLRPHDGPAETDWRAGVLASLPDGDGFRTPRPVRTITDEWRHGAWEAWEWLPGQADETRVADVIRAGTAFHRAIAGLERPAFLMAKDDAWSRADRAVWGDGALPRDPSLDRLVEAFRPVEAPSQLVHGDLLGNVLFVDGHPPAVIDWPPYWRPAGLGAAIAAVDAVCWHGHPLDGLERLGDGVPEWSQLLVRALAFRIATLLVAGAWGSDDVERHAPVIDAVLGRAPRVGTLDAS
ncbi:hypothetical protein [Curtobacterium sp. Curtsp57]|uniref:hypothetical protein n=1 Tax=Curtobacterium sp. Curtsp57 TaxID=3243047 RepID=UPI0039B53DD1